MSASSFGPTLNLVVVVGVILAGIGYAVGQFWSQRRRGQSDALQVALDEIQALQVRADRQSREISELRARVAELSAENVTLRSLIRGTE